MSTRDIQIGIALGTITALIALTPWHIAVKHQRNTPPQEYVAVGHSAINTGSSARRVIAVSCPVNYSTTGRGF